MVMTKDEAEKAKQNGLRRYEMIYVLSPELEEEKLNSTIEGINQFITQKGGSTPEVERWGKRKLAYPIKHFLEGNYVLTRFQIKPASSRQLEARLEISEGVLRHLLVNLDEK